MPKERQSGPANSVVDRRPSAGSGHWAGHRVHAFMHAARPGCLWAALRRLHWPRLLWGMGSILGVHEAEFPFVRRCSRSSIPPLLPELGGTAATAFMHACIAFVLGASRMLGALGRADKWGFAAPCAPPLNEFPFVRRCSRPGIPALSPSSAAPPRLLSFMHACITFVLGASRMLGALGRVDEWGFAAPCPPLEAPFSARTPARLPRRHSFIHSS
jgi:hypothetical protein